jgi:AcrR family transcriptional regulator
MNSPKDRQERASSAETRTAIMEATHRALCKHGYANLTIQNIADEFDMTSAVLHYHYNTKDELLAAFLERVLDWYADQIDVDDIDDPRDRLEVLINALLIVLLDLDDPTSDGASEEPSLEQGEAFSMALLEMRAQAGRDEEFREQFTANYDYAKDIMVATIEEGIEQGEFRAVNPEQVASLLLSAMLGGRAYHVSLTHDGTAPATRNALVDLILDDLLLPDLS